MAFLEKIRTFAKNSEKMKYLIIGLGNFGRTLAEELTDKGHEVIGVDTVEQLVDLLKDRISVTYIMDATDPVGLRSLPLNQIDQAIVAIGKGMDYSLRVVAALKEQRVLNIAARAIDEVHMSILRAMGINQIFIPETYAARTIASHIDSNTPGDLI